MIDSTYQNDISVQDYTSQPIISGVKLIDLKLYTDEQGDFTEISRLHQGILELFPEFEVKQINISTLLPYVVKSFHFHMEQDDVFYVPPTKRLLVGLKDLRKDSPTKDSTMRLVLGGHHNQLLFIPREVAHGVGNLWPTESTIIYLVNNQFNINKLDEYRLPPDLLGEDFWQLPKN